MDISELEDKHKGESVLILGTGPSLRDFSDNLLLELSQDKAVFALKQAYNYGPNIASYHFLNSANIQHYSYQSPIHIILELASNELGWSQQIPHHNLVVVGDNTDFSKSLSSTHDFETWTMENSPDSRPFGPGLLWETVLYSAIHMGFTHIYSVGIDLGPPGEAARSHFYGTGHRVNELSKDETEGEIPLSRAFYRWIQAKGIEWTVLSKGSYLSPEIPRKE